jgi:hypothetical protein
MPTFAMHGTSTLMMETNTFPVTLHRNYVLTRLNAQDGFSVLWWNGFNLLIKLSSVTGKCSRRLVASEVSTSSACSRCYVVSWELRAVKNENSCRCTSDLVDLVNILRTEFFGSAPCWKWGLVCRVMTCMWSPPHLHLQGIIKYHNPLIK